MRADLHYLGRSAVREVGAISALSFAPNLARPKVFFDAEIGQPVRFREAISALHDVVVGDLRARPKDRSAYEAWKLQKQSEQEAIRKAIADQTTRQELERIASERIPEDLPGQFQKMHGLYWTARRQWADELTRNDPELFRHLVPCDPVVTVAPDVVFFECFAKDESSYGCLSVDRDAFRGAGDAGLGTTNVDYSLALYDHFQTLRSYRPTRLLVDPEGFNVKVENRQEYREEKIDLPASWLRGFGQLQAAMAMPSRKVELSVDAVYSILAHLRRHREKTGPRCLRFVLDPGKPVRVILDPWGVEIASKVGLCTVERREEVRVWGRRRLFPLARVLPLAERFEVRLLGSGLPSVWVAHLGEMRLVLALSGWTSNDWTSGTQLDQHFAGVDGQPAVVDAIGAYLEKSRAATMAELRTRVMAGDKVLLGSLLALAKRGQLAYDFARNAVRWRPILPIALSETMLGPEPEEVREGKRLVREDAVRLEREETIEVGKRLIVARVQNTVCEGIVDADGAFSRAKCKCSHFYKYRLRAGPCRHLLALRTKAFSSVSGAAVGRREIVLHLATETLRGVMQQAQGSGVDVAEVIEKVWDGARAFVQVTMKASDLGTGSQADKLAQRFEVSSPVAEEMWAEAARLDLPVSELFEAAWRLVKGSKPTGGSILH